MHLYCRYEYGIEYELHPQNPVLALDISNDESSVLFSGGADNNVSVVASVFDDMKSNTSMRQISLGTPGFFTTSM